MPRRHILTERQRKVLFDLPTDEGALLRHYILDNDDIEHIRTRRHAHNKLGFALQLCAFRYPGRLLTAGEIIPLPVTEFSRRSNRGKASRTCWICRNQRDT